MKQDKIQEAYNKMLSEGRFSYDSKYMDKANDTMADFLEELEDAIPGPKEPKGKELIKFMRRIDSDWERLWDNIGKLVKQL